jgi:predicted RNA-binding protein with RPS1 domain
MKDFAQFIGKTMLIKLIEYNEEKRRFVGSARVLQAENRKNAEEKIFSEIEIGRIYHGTVRSMTDFGVFVDIGGVEGLVHISELSWSKIRHPSQVLKIGDEIDVFVLNFDLEKKRISLGYKRIEDNPWTNIEERYPTGSVVKGRVARIVPFGAFIELERGVDGLVHISCVSNHRINRVEEVLKIGEEIEAKVIESNPVEMRISLSIKALLPPEEPKPWVKPDYNNAARAKPDDIPENAAEAAEQSAPEAAPADAEPAPETAFEAALGKAVEVAAVAEAAEAAASEAVAEAAPTSEDAPVAEESDAVAAPIEEEPPELKKKVAKPRAKKAPKTDESAADSIESEEAKPEA